MKPTIKKTIVKGLYLTIDGKAWHKSSKCELKPTLKGKVRFNGKLYDLQKLMNVTKPKPTKTKVSNPKPVKKRVSIRELQKQGLNKTEISGLFVANNGLCYNSTTNRNLAITKGKITINGKAYNVAKIILKTFCKIPIRSGQIVFKNRNNKDFSFENLEYATTGTYHAPPKETDLVKIIRLYFEVPKKMNRQNLMYKFHLHEIATKRGFIYLHTGKDFDLFLQWLNPYILAQSQSKQEVSIKNGYSTTNGINAINKYLSLLTNDCLKDFENGLLNVKDFEPKPPTKTQKLRDLQKSVNEWGLNVKIPLRKKSNRELLSNYEKHLKEIDSKIKNPENEPPK
jgi:hypothetical protein